MSDPTAGPSPDLLYFEDFVVGETVRFGHTAVSRDDILAFAREFDPQPFHLDETAAKDSLLGGLAASGWHVCGLLMRMACDDYLNRSASMGGAGISEIRWSKPVRPGDTLTARRTCLETRLSANRPDMGIVKFYYEAINQHGDAVMTWIGVAHLFACRPTDTGRGAEDVTGDAIGDAAATDDESAEA